MKKNKGYIAIFSTIILMAVFLLLFIGMFALSLGGMSRATDKEKSTLSLFLTDICIEKALNEIKKDTSYLVGVAEGETMVFGGNYCKIDNMEEPLSDIRIFRATGSFDDYQKIVEVEVLISESDNERTLSISSWEEV